MPDLSRLTIDDDKAQLVVFEVGNDLYAVDIMKVVEIHRMLKVKPVPKTPGFLMGVVSFRGQVLPVIDLRERLSVEPQASEQEARIVQIRLENASDTGVIVDAVREVLKLPASDIREAPDLVSKLRAEYLLGVVQPDPDDDETLIFILDADRLLTETEKDVLNSIDETATDQTSPDESPSAEAPLER